MQSAMAQNQDPLYGLQEAAERLGISQFTLRRWCKLGKVEHYKMGSRLKVAGSEIARTRALAKVKQ